MNRQASDPRAALSKAVSARQHFSIGFGSIIGVGWIIFVGDWLNHAGPVGSILAFLSGGFLMALVALCYAELASMFPVSGGEVAYSFETFGVGVAFACGWALILPYTVLTAFEAIAVAWLLDILFPGLAGPTLYTVLGYPITASSLFVGIGGMLLFTYLNYRGVRSATTAQDWLTYGLIVMSAIFMLAGIGGGELGHLRPIFSENFAPFVGFMAVLITVPNWLAGFNVIPQMMEETERGTRLKAVAGVMVVSVALGAVFYCLVILSASMAMPWQELLDDELPASAAFQAAFNSQFFAKSVLLAGLFGLLSTWNAVILASSRLLFALGRAQIVPTSYGTPHPKYETPAKALVFVCCVGIGATFAGRGILAPIINASSSSFALAFLISCMCVIWLRQKQPGRTKPFCVPGGRFTAGIAGICCLALFILSFYLPWTSSTGVPTEWIIIAVWVILGLIFWVTGTRFRSQITTAERRRLILGEAGQEN